MNPTPSITPERTIIAGILPVFLAGALFHYLYDITGRSAIAGAFAPVNESIWEHLKMVPLPLLAWWALAWLFLRRRGDPPDRDRWFTAALVSLGVSLVAVPAMFYLYTGALGIQRLFIDIAILLVALILGQLLARHVYKHATGIDYRPALALYVGLILLFVWFTFAPPRLPLFRDPLNGSYGIQFGDDL